MMILLSILNVIVLFSLLKYEQKVNNKNIFTPGSIFVYFAYLPAISNLYFAFNQDIFYDVVLSQVSQNFRDLAIVNLALLFVILGNIITYIGISHGLNSDNKIFNIIMNKILSTKNYHKNKETITYQKKIFKFGRIVYILGFIVYLVFIQKMGGVLQIWNELNLRSTNNAGLGYYQTFYMISIQFGGMIIIWYLKLRKSKFLIPVFITTLFILGSLGARGPVIIYILSLIIMNHYLFKKVKSIFNIRTVLITFLLSFFILGVLQFREKSLDYYLNNNAEFVNDTFSDIESGLIARIGRLERDVVILGYFNKNNFWYGKSYLGLLSAPIPRTIYPDKPPVDSGMYLRCMALGDILEPPLATHKLRGSSWPEHNWIGYMNFGVFGFCLLYYFSGLLFGKFYNYVKQTNFNIFSICIFSMLAVGGAPILSPPGLVKLLTHFILISLLINFIYLPINKSKKN